MPLNDQLLTKLSSLANSKKSLKQDKTRLEAKNEKLVEKVKTMIKKDGERLGQGDSEDLVEIMEKAVKESSSDYQKLLIQQQLDYNKATTAKNMRWHPTIIKWCLYITSKSPKAYKLLRESGFLKLPSERTLYDYSHVVKGK